MLANGALLEGSVERTPDEVVVRQDGGEVRLRPGRVVHVAATPVAIYEHLRAQFGTDAEGHLQLADWAIDNRLWPQAALELLEARQLDPRSRRLELLERRLDVLSQPPPSTSPVTEPEAPAVPDAAEESPEGPLPRMPDDALKQFTRKIQPVLLNGCVECHRGEAGDRFPLDPAWLQGHGNADSTQANLRTALAAIDLGSPTQSPLLAAARGPHAGTSPFAGARQEDLLSRLEDWVVSIARLNAVELPPAPPNPQAYAAMPMAPAASAPSSPSEVEQASYQIEGYEPLVSKPIQRGVRLRRVEPRDEFDPAIFNERFRRPEDDLPLAETR